MKMKPIISPDVINILCEDDTPHVEQPIYSAPQPEPQAQPQPEQAPKRSFWGRVGGFFKKVYEVAKPVINVINTIAGAVNAAVRFKNSFRGRADWQGA